MAEQPEILSKGQFAIRCGKMPSAVSNWIARGKIAGAALTADGRIVVDEALRQLGQTVDPGNGRPSIADLASPPPPTAFSRADPVESLAKVRLARETLALEAQQRAAAIERGELMRVDEASRAWAAELEDLLLATEQFIIDLPAKFGLGREAAETARHAWREFRRRRVEQLAEGKAGDPHAA